MTKTAQTARTFGKRPNVAAHVPTVDDVRVAWTANEDSAHAARHNLQSRI